MPLVFAGGLLEIPVFGIWMIGIEAVIAVIGWRSCASCRVGPTTVADLAAPRAWLSSLVLFLAATTFVWKVAVLPVWTWDHYMVWGMKTRRMADGGFLDLEFLKAVPFLKANPDYPLGLPVLWRLLTLGHEPVAADFKICHALFGLAVVLLVRLILLEAGSSPFRANTVAAFVGISPLFWSTESVGIAEMPLCAAALAGLCLVLRWQSTSNKSAVMVSGVLLGFLPWIKKEGLSLALLIFGAGWLLARRRAGWKPMQALPALVGLSLVAGGTLVVEWSYLPRGTSFFVGSWWSRAAHRVPATMDLLGAMGKELVASDWLGFWIAFPLIMAWALYRRADRTVAVCIVVVGQSALYTTTYFATYLDPVFHVNASLFRVMGALLPLAAVGVGLLGLGTERRTYHAPGAPAPR